MMAMMGSRITKGNRFAAIMPLDLGARQET